MSKRNLGFVAGIFSKIPKVEERVEFGFIQTPPYVRDTVDYVTWIEIPPNAVKVEMKVGEAVASWSFPPLSDLETTPNREKLVASNFERNIALPSRRIVFANEYLTFGNRCNMSIRFFSSQNEITTGVVVCCGFYNDELRQTLSKDTDACTVQVVTEFSESLLYVHPQKRIIISSPGRSRLVQ